ncbi:MAG TPA: hypothetical protein VE441_09875 [Mycobacterium sp.]|nr:hypothetical protein [Mycobacterium sp.]
MAEGPTCASGEHRAHQDFAAQFDLGGYRAPIQGNGVHRNGSYPIVQRLPGVCTAATTLTPRLDDEDRADRRLRGTAGAHRKGRYDATTDAVST